MRFKSGFVVGLGAGYVLGTKAGQERYEKIVGAAKQLRENPGVQRLTGEVNKTVSLGKDRVSETASRTVEQASDAAAAQASKAKEAVANASKKSDSSTSTTTSTSSTGS